MQALRHEILPPSGVEFSACLKLTPATASGSPTTSQTVGRALFNVVVARSNFLRIFEVREEPQPISSAKDDERERRASVRKGTEAVEGEVEMDASGEGFVNMGSVKVNRVNTHYHISCPCHCCTSSMPFSVIQILCECENFLIQVLTIQLSLVYRPKWGSNTTYCEALLLHTRTPFTWHRYRHGTH